MQKLQTYREFFPFYLNEHSQALTRKFHYVGTSLAMLCFAAFVITFNPWFLLAGLVGAYGLAWYSHFNIEHNKPATFTYPLWSFIADHHMLFLAVTRRLQPALTDAQAKYQKS